SGDISVNRARTSGPASASTELSGTGSAPGRQAVKPRKSRRMGRKQRVRVAMVRDLRMLQIYITAQADQITWAQRPIFGPRQCLLTAGHLCRKALKFYAMQLTLDRNLIFFDIESTGLNIVRDRIIQLAMVRYHPDGSPPEERSYLVNPGIPIPPEATAVHKITQEDVADQPMFSAYAREIRDFIGDADLA